MQPTYHFLKSWKKNSSMRKKLSVLVIRHPSFWKLSSRRVFGRYVLPSFYLLFLFLVCRDSKSILQINDVRGNDEVTISRKFGDEKYVFSHLAFFKQLWSKSFLAFDSYFLSEIFILKRILKNLRVIQNQMSTKKTQLLILFELLFLSPRFLFSLSHHIGPINSWYHYSLLAQDRLTSTWCARKANLLSRTSRFMMTRIWASIWLLKQIGNDGVCISVLR